MSSDNTGPDQNKDHLANTALEGGINMAEQGGETHGIKPKPASKPTAGRPSPPQGSGGGSSAPDAT